MAYVTLTELKLYRGIANTNANDDALLTSLIGRAEQQIDNYCHRTFLAPTTAATRYYDALRDVSDDRRTLYLDEDLASIKEHSIQAAAGELVTVMSEARKLQRELGG